MTKSRDKDSTTWAVFRQDDNGNTFVVQTGLTQTQAEQLVAEFEHKGHKQLYWATPEEDRTDINSGD